jgi:putative tricarboxylic transport membrane protein
MSRRADRIAGATLLVIAVAVGIEATTFDVAFLADPVGPKALPLVVALLLAFGGFRTLVRPRPRGDIDLPEATSLARIGAAIVVFLLYAGALPWLGFFLSTTLVVAALAVLFGGPWKGGVAAGLTLSAALWLLFVALLSLALPIGELWIL